MSPSGRPASWLAGWRVALRMARRDLRRYRGRSALVLVMVAVPMVLLVGGWTWYVSSTPSADALRPLTMGSAQAELSTRDLTRAVDVQSVDGVTAGTGDQEAAPLPGVEEDDSIGARADALQTVTGGQVSPAAAVSVRFPRPAGGVVSDSILIMDTSIDLGDKATLLDGRWPEGPDEIVATPAGEALGLPSEGPVDITFPDGSPRTVDVVGSAEAWTSWGGMPVAVSADLSLLDPQAPDLTWLVFRDDPVLWPEVRDLNAYGFVVRSAAVLDDPTQAAADPDMFGMVDEGVPGDVAAAGGAAIGLVALVTLLAGPAFAVSAARQRHTLSLAAVTGATSAHLRRILLAQALLLGVLASVIGVAIGVLAGWLLVLNQMRLYPSAPAVFTVPWGPALFLVAAGAVACLVAALLPARGLGRLDVVAPMRARVSPPPGRRLPVVGLMLAAIGSTALWVSTFAMVDVGTAIGAIILTIGLLLCVPWLMQRLAAISSHLPLPLRVAGRDTARHRARTVPTVTAVLTATAIAAASAVYLASEAATGERDYVPGAADGEGFLRVAPDSSPSAEHVRDEIAQRIPTVGSTVEYVAYQDSMLTDPQSDQWTSSMVAVVPEGCSVADAAPGGMGGGMAAPDCARAGAELGGQQLAVFPAAEMVRRFGLEGAEADAVRDGAVVVPSSSPLASADSVRLTALHWDGSGAWPTEQDVTTEVTVPVVASPAPWLEPGFEGELAHAAAPLELADQESWPLAESRVAVYVEGRALTATEEADLAAWWPEAGSRVERGYEPVDGVATQLLLYGIAGGLVLLITLIATALAVSEQQEDQATFAAVGATRGTRRALAASHALATGLLGSVLGILLGGVVGAAVVVGLRDFDYLTQTSALRDSALVLPALPLLGLAVGVPLIAAALAALAIRRAPQVTRRAA